MVRHLVLAFTGFATVATLTARIAREIEGVQVG